MILDAQNLFCSAIAMPTGAAAGSTNVIDLSVTDRSILGDLSVLFVWTGTNPAGTSLQIELRSTDANTGVTTTDLNTSAVVHWSSGVILAADYPEVGFVSGVYFAIKLPYPLYQPNLAGTGVNDTNGYKRYLGLYFTGVGTVAGSLTSGIVRDVDIQNYIGGAYVLAAM